MLAQTQYEAIINAIDEGVIVLNADGEVQMMSAASEALLNISTEAMIGRPLTYLPYIDENFLENTRFPFERQVIAEDNQPVHITAKKIVHQNTAHIEYVLIVKPGINKDDLRKKNVSPQRQDQRDFLTGALTRHHFVKHLAELLSVAVHHEADNTHAFIYLDIDQFKAMNDVLGHTAGDQLLNAIANIIPKWIRGSDILGRLGDDEFGIILVNCKPEPALKIARNIAKAINDCILPAHKTNPKVTASIGLLTIDSQYQDLSDVMRDAEIACNIAKKEGGNRIHEFTHTDENETRYKSKVDWLDRIHQAFEEDRFVLYYQSIASTHSDSGLHGEVLVRLLDENNHIINPNDFMPSMEHFYLSSMLDRYVIDKVFDFLEADAAVTAQVSMLSINLSGQSINDALFRRHLLNKVKSAKFNLGKVCFEITESVALEHLDIIIPFIQSVKKLGVQFALDDFGNGASSFTYLRKLPIDYLKIDGQLIVNIENEVFSQLTVECLTKIAKISGAKTIAEWVESKDVLESVTQLGVDFIQGYHHHKPEPIRDFFQSHLNSKVEALNAP